MEVSIGEKMSVLNQFHPEEVVIGKKDLQIWNNEAFDNGDDSNNFMKKSVSIKDSIDSSFSSKENQSPSGFSPSWRQEAISIKSFNSHNRNTNHEAIGDSKDKVTK